MDNEFDVPDAVSFTMATIALAYPLLKDFWEKPKLNVYAHITQRYNAETKEQPWVLLVKITNTGGNPIVVDGYEFRDEDDAKILLPDIGEEFFHKRLEPYDCFSVKLEDIVLQQLIKEADQLDSFAVYDTRGKRWALPKKLFQTLKATLQERQAKNSK